jgi:ketosteroid isomerase-like protein
MDNKFDSLTALVNGALKGHIEPSDDFLELFADDAVFRFPFAPEGLPKKLEGRTELAAHMAHLGPLLEFGTFTLHAAYHSGDTVIFECSCTGRGVETGLRYDQDYICVVRMASGRIVEYRDYWNPLIVISALGGEVAALPA